MTRHFEFTARVQPQLCPRCFKLLDAISCQDGEHMPKPGDHTVCIGCASVLRWNDAMQFELSSLMDVPIAIRRDFARIVETVQQMKGRSS
jgi:hypothetical protein